VWRSDQCLSPRQYHAHEQKCRNEQHNYQNAFSVRSHDGRIPRPIFAQIRNNGRIADDKRYNDVPARPRLLPALFSRVLAAALPPSPPHLRPELGRTDNQVPQKVWRIPFTRLAASNNLGLCSHCWNTAVSASAIEIGHFLIDRAALNTESRYSPVFTGTNCVVNMTLSSGMSLSRPISINDCLRVSTAFGSNAPLRRPGMDRELSNEIEPAA
jgi:hypothetical protein